MRQPARAMAALVLVLVVGACDDIMSPEVPNVAVAVDLGIAPIPQSLANWCWLASGEMVFRYHGIPAVNPIDYQCGVLAMLAGQGSSCWYNCALCNTGAPSIAHVRDMIVLYPHYANQYFGGGVPQLTAQWTTSPLSDAAMIQSLDAGRPIVVGVSPSGFRFPAQVSEHAVVVVGYGLHEGAAHFLVNDPWPYDQFPGQNPYLAGGGIQRRPGQYLIPSAALRHRLVLREAVYDIRAAAAAAAAA